MKLVVVQCGVEGCTNSFDHPDSFTEEEVEQRATANGWTKSPDGTWVGCANPQGCQLVLPKETKAS